MWQRFKIPLYKSALILVLTLCAAVRFSFGQGFEYTWDQAPPEQAWKPYVPLSRLTDEEGVFQHVATEIGVNAYRGSLRGVAGTAFAQSGNSVDKALLLIALLKEIGQTQFRIARTQLSPEQATALASEYLSDLQASRQRILDAISYDGIPDIPAEYVEELLDQRRRRLALVEELASVVSHK